MAIEIDGLPSKHGDFPWQTVSHNQRVYDISPNKAIWRYLPESQSSWRRDSPPRRSIARKVKQSHTLWICQNSY